MKNKLNKHLYQFCDLWFHGGAVYFYSDPHFGDKEMNEYRAIADEEQIKKINSVAHKADTLVILGDVGDIECVKKLKAGYKVLVMGNHDRGKSLYEPYFDEVYDGPLTISDKILLSHEPLDVKYHLNIHGHNHNTDTEDKYHINCCAEWLEYTPLNLNMIIKVGALSQIQSIHRATIDKATEKHKEKMNEHN